MMLLDTNILSEMMKTAPQQKVMVFLDSQPIKSLFICTITQAEIELGISLLPDGKRKVKLKEIASKVLGLFTARNLVFGSEAATAYAHIVAKQHKKGRTMSVEDAQIAAIAHIHDMQLVTRNSKDFETISGLRLLNPWFK